MEDKKTLTGEPRFLGEQLPDYKNKFLSDWVDRCCTISNVVGEKLNFKNLDEILQIIEKYNIPLDDNDIVTDAVCGLIEDVVKLIALCPQVYILGIEDMHNDE